jgi:Flp pilus assembly pilin Flp
MMKLFSAVQRLTKDRKGQDLIEYALLGGTFAVVIGAIFPPTIMPNVSSIFSKVVSSFNAS